MKQTGLCVSHQIEMQSAGTPRRNWTDQSNIKSPSLSFWGAGQPSGHQIKSHHSQSPERLTQQRHLQIVVWAATGPKEEKRGSSQSNLTLLDFRSGRSTKKDKWPQQNANIPPTCWSSISLDGQIESLPGQQAKRL
jgi:hypothetical protein